MLRPHYECVDLDWTHVCSRRRSANTRMHPWNSLFTFFRRNNVKIFLGVGAAIIPMTGIWILNFKSVHVNTCIYTISWRMNNAFPHSTFHIVYCTRLSFRLLPNSNDSKTRRQIMMDFLTELEIIERTKTIFLMMWMSL